MAYDPEATVARPLLALTTSPPYSRPHQRRSWLWRRPRALFLIAAGTLTLLALTALFGPAAGLPIPDSLSEYIPSRPFPPPGSNPPPPPHGGSPPSHPHPPPPPPPDSNSHTPLDTDASNAGLGNIDAAITALYAAQPHTPAAARARYTLKTGRTPPHGFDAFVDYAGQHGCLVDAYDGVHADFLPFWQAERRAPQRGWFRQRVKVVEERLKKDSRGLTALTVRDGKVHRPEYQGTYFDGDWENTINKFASALPPLTVIINGRDEPRVVFDALQLFEDNTTTTTTTSFLDLTDRTPFALSPPSTAAFFAPRAGCKPRGGGVGDVSFLTSASSAEFTTDLVPVLSMAKVGGGVPSLGLGGGLDTGAGVGDAAGGGQGGGGGGGGGEHTCFADVLVPGEFYYRNSWWAGKFEYPDNVAWADKRDVLYWRGKSNGGHIRGTNYQSFPRFRLIDLAARPENVQKGLFDVRMTGWHESHCTTDDCDAEAIKKAYNISGEVVPREEAYQYKYLLDVDGNTFSGRYLGLLRSGGLVFKSTAFTEFFTPWLVPFEHFIPVRPDLADLPAKIEWARANDAEVRTFIHFLWTGADDSISFFMFTRHSSFIRHLINMIHAFITTPPRIYNDPRIVTTPNDQPRCTHSRQAHRIQESGRVFAERVLTDAQNDCYWFAVMLEWGALWGED
ncbi:hypothetical protein C8R44DRAFT_893220 [Mycena epipterygia]|nr:hypothetical protein C8R44DRAFT_893220 [Mycena epipterygia]